MKREADDRPAGHHQDKKSKHEDRHAQYQRHDRPRDDPRRDGRPKPSQDNRGNRPGQARPHKQPASYQDALSKLPPSTSQSADVPAYVPFTVSTALPMLPQIAEGPLTTAPFMHKSRATYNRASSTNDVTYERLEFIGDAYIELIASRLIFERYYNLTAGQQSQLRELLVKNETLAEYSRAYGFEGRIEAEGRDRMLEDAARSGKGNKGFNKVLGDVFEAYIAALVLSDVEHGFAVAEKWLTALWAPKLLEGAHSFRPSTSIASANDDPLATYNPSGKADLQKRVGANKTIKLDYETYQDSVELKGAQLGQTQHFIALYLTGYGYERKLLGKGKGRNKVEAGNWAAQRAMFGEGKDVVDECEKANLAKKEKMRLEREKEALETEGKGEEGGKR